MWDIFLLCATDALGLVVVARLLGLKLHRVYSVFCFFVLLNLVNSTVTGSAIGSWLRQNGAHTLIDYRIVWIAFAVLGWVAVLWMVYALLQALLDTLPGILIFSRKLLNFAVLGSVLVALFSARPEFAAAQHPGASLLHLCVSVAFILERVITTVALLVLLAMLGFVLWFPVRIPRNLIVFSFSYIGYFGAHTALLLMRDLSHRFDPYKLSLADGILLGCCFLVIAVGVRKRGETVPVRVGQRWETGHQQRMIHQLEAMNASLLKSVPRP